MSPCCFYGFVSKTRFSTLLKYDVKVLSCSIIHTLFLFSGSPWLGSVWRLSVAPPRAEKCSLHQSFLLRVPTKEKKTSTNTSGEKLVGDVGCLLLCARGSGKSALSLLNSAGCAAATVMRSYRSLSLWSRAHSVWAQRKTEAVFCSANKASACIYFLWISPVFGTTRRPPGCPNTPVVLSSSLLALKGPLSVSRPFLRLSAVLL